jgi:hypothetical protein
MKDKLSHRQELAAGMLARGCPCPRVAQELGITVRTLRRWRQQSLFCARLQEETARFLADNEVKATHDLFPDAIKALKDLLGSGSAIARLGATRIVLQALGLTRKLSLAESKQDLIFEESAQLITEIFKEDEEMRMAALAALKKRKLDKAAEEFKKL